MLSISELRGGEVRRMQRLTPADISSAFSSSFGKLLQQSEKSIVFASCRVVDPRRFLKNYVKQPLRSRRPEEVTDS
jgi:hypothetical protein